MSEFKQEIIDALRVKRPNLSASSLRTYSILLVSLGKKIAKEQKLSNFSDDATHVMKVIDTNYVSEFSRKTILSALFVLTEIPEYRAKMYISIERVSEHYKTHELSENQAKNRISFAQVVFKVNLAKQQLRLHPCLSNYQNYLIAALMSGIFVPPKRNELALVKLRDYDDSKDNYCKKNVICFNNYKTSAKYGTQTIVIPKELQKIFSKYLELLGDSEYLFFNTNTGKPFDVGSGFTQKLQSIFGKGIGCSALRSIYISEKYKDCVPQKEMEATAEAMGHSVGMAMGVYCKKLN